MQRIASAVSVSRTAGTFNLAWAALYSEKKAAQRNPILAIKALAHKIARACYYVMRDKVPFDPARLFG